MKTPASRLLLLCLASSLAVGAFAACQKPEPLAKDPRLGETGQFNINWPLKATTLEGAVAEVEASIGPGKTRAGGLVEWTAQVDATHCARIQLKNDGKELFANKEKLMEAHPDFAACIAAK